MHDLDPVVVAGVLSKFCFDLRRVANEKKFIDESVFAQRHHSASYEAGWAKITAHGVEGDLHQCEILRAKMADCKAKICTPLAYRAPRTAISLRALTPVAHGSNRTTGMQCGTPLRCHIAGIYSGAGHASGLRPCAIATASSTFSVLELPWQAFTEAHQG